MADEARELVQAVHGKYSHLGPMTEEQQESAHVIEIDPRVSVRNRIEAHQTEVILRLDDEACCHMDRREFRQLVSGLLNKAGDALMAAWDQLHGEQP